MRPCNQLQPSLAGELSAKLATSIQRRVRTCCSQNSRVHRYICAFSARSGCTKPLSQQPPQLPHPHSQLLQFVFRVCSTSQVRHGDAVRDRLADRDLDLDLGTDETRTKTSGKSTHATEICNSELSVRCKTSFPSLAQIHCVESAAASGVCPRCSERSEIRYRCARSFRRK